MDFRTWLEKQGCATVITQEEDGNGYYCLDVTTPEGSTYDITVSV